MMKQLALLLLAMAGALSLRAQQTTIYTEANRAYKQGTEFLDQGLLGQAQEAYKQAIDLLLPVNESAANLLRTKAEFGYAKCAVQRNLPDGEKLILDFIRDHAPDPLATEALVEVANYYYNAEQYDKAITYYAQVPTTGMSKEKRAEVRFRMGYSFFVQKKFAQAKNNFKEIANVDGEYNAPANYYLGLCYFFDGDYDGALKHLRTVENTPKYRPHIPYYLAQIYFAQRRYDELIAYVEPRLNQRDVRNETEIRQLLGQAYFEKGDYAKALPHLEYYAERSGKLREEEFYQLGFAQYKTGNYKKAIASFNELSAIESPLGQSANYYLADCYLKTGQKASARTAFGNAKRLNYDKELKEDALFNYAKLSYELKDPREAISALQEISPQSKYYLEAQSLMGDIFLSYRDYKQALEILDRLPNKTPKIQESYQKVAYLRGLQLLQEENLPEAKTLFNKSLQFPVDLRTKALATYWLADIASREKQYDTSIRQMSQFLTMAKTINNLPDESSLFTGNYLQGYNYLKQKNYTAALSFFKETVAGITRNRSFISSEDVKNKVLGDAIMRSGDCHFKRNQYTEAVSYYDEAIDKRYSNYVYAIFQKAIIEGLRGRTTDKILALERIPKEFPESEYADDALLQLGTTYQEIGQLNKALPPLRDLVTKYKNKSDLVNQALLQLGLITYNQGSPETAINYYKQVFSNNPDPEEARVALAALEEIYVNDLGKPDEYFAFLETVPGYKVDNMSKDSINFKAAETQYLNANYQRAVESYTDYIRKFPNGQNLLTAYFHRGESYTVLKQYNEALRDYEYVIGKGQSRYYTKALEKAAIIAYNYSQDFNKSYDLYSKLEAAATTEDTRFEAQVGAMQSAYRVGNLQAVNSLANKVASSPNATQTQKATANFYQGKIAFDRKDYENAMRFFNEVVRLSDNEQTAEARYQIAFIYYQKRNLDKAQELCISANKESSAYPYWVAKSVLLLSDILAEKGDLYNARAALEALLENYDEDPDIVRTAQDKLNAINKQINQGSRLNRDTDNNRLELIDGNN